MCERGLTSTYNPTLLAGVPVSGTPVIVDGSKIVNSVRIVTVELKWVGLRYEGIEGSLWWEGGKGVYR